jgi:hypothetical protein
MHIEHQPMIEFVHVFPAHAEINSHFSALLSASLHLISNVSEPVEAEGHVNLFWFPFACAFGEVKRFIAPE